jgi:glycosyltransferase involved in cell wall biosynthesis
VPDSRDVILLSTADWDNPYWTNKQHVAVELGRRGFKVLYVEVGGGRRPTVSGRDFRRIVARVRNGIRRPRRVQPNIWVWSPFLIPLHSFRLVRAFNRFALRLGVAVWASVLRLNPKVLWTYSPLTTELCNISKFALTVYHAVDDMKEQPGMPRAAMMAAEAELCRSVDVIFTTAPNLFEMHRTSNPHTYYFNNVADFGHFNRALSAETVIPADLSAIAGPRIGFIGAVSGYKLDLDLIRSAATMRPDWSFVLIGEVGEGDPWTDVSALREIRNIHLLGGRAYSELPAYLKGIDVAILPNRENEYTKSMFPMKFFEYLAAGRPVVSTRLPALADYSDVATFADGAEAFVAAVDAAISGHAPSLESRLARAREQTYESRTGRMLDVVRKLKPSAM